LINIKRSIFLNVQLRTTVFVKVDINENIFSLSHFRLFVKMRLASLSTAYGSASTLLLLLLTTTATATASKTAGSSRSPDAAKTNKATVYEAEYRKLHDHTEDKDGLESIR
jgi:hypothetical protein